MKKSHFSIPLICSMILLMLTAFVPGEESAPPLPAYLDTSYSFEERAADLVSRLTIEEKQSLIGNSMAPVPRLGINIYNVWGEALHGLVGMFNPNYKSATSFPNSVAVGASWDPDLLEREATAISDEARGVNHTVIAGLTFWSPVVEPARDPRWGRTGESYGEDPFLISQIAGGFIRGMMGNDPDYLKAVPIGKHYFANNSEFNRHTGTSNMDDRDMREFYLAPYRKLIEKDNLPSIMTCYNRVNYVPITASTYFVDSLARKTYGLNGYVTGDCGAVSDIYMGHHYAGSNAVAAALALKAGVDTDCGDVFQTSAIQALNQGLIEESDIDRALVHMFTIRMRIGEFDPIEKVPYSGIPEEVVNSPENAALALEVATKTPVLLKNEKVNKKKGLALPLDPEKIKKIAVIGPMADRVVLGPYSGTPLESNMITPLNGLNQYLSKHGYQIEVSYSSGANTKSSSNLFYVSGIGFRKADGNVLKIDPTKYDASSGGFSIDTREEVPSLRRINDGSWTAYFGIDISNLDSILVDLAVVDAGGSVEIRVGSETGNVLATFELPAIQESMGFIFRRQQTYRARVNQLGLSGPQNVYVVYHAPSAVPIDEETLALAAEADVALVFVGTDDRTASEESDRLTLTLPGNQYDLIRAVAGANPHTVVVMQTLGMVEVDQFKDLPGIPGILWTGYNGQAQGAAMAKILFGEVNPGGKLNSSWYRSVNDLPDISDYELRGGSQKNGRTYWYFDKEVSYEFGYGLSYSTFKYSNFQISTPTITPNDEFTISVDVTNNGKMDGDEVVQVYMTTPEADASLQRPVKRLRGFRRVSVPAGQTLKVDIRMDGPDLWFWDADRGSITFDQGTYVFEIGASSKDIRGKVEARMDGAYHAILKTVVAEADKTVLNLGDQVQTRVTASMSDDRFSDMTGAELRYFSGDDGILQVDGNGLVTAVGAGAASVSASVTIEGVTLSDSYPLVVLPDLTLDQVRVDGKELETFSKGTQSISLLLEDGSGPVPVIEAIPEATGAQIRVDQAEGIPGTAVVTVTDPKTAREMVYMVNMGLASRGDEFEGTTPGDQWSWIRENSANWSLIDNPGYLTIVSEEGGLQGASNNAANLVLQSANTDWVIESKLELNRKPVRVGEQGGIIAYQDDDNYVKLILTRASGGFFGDTDASIELAVEREGSQNSAAKIPVTGWMKDEGLPTVVLKLEKKGNTYFASYSGDGSNFKSLGSTEIVLSDIQAGMIVSDGIRTEGGIFAAFLSQQNQGLEPMTATFDYFRIENTGLN